MRKIEDMVKECKRLKKEMNSVTRAYKRMRLKVIDKVIADNIMNKAPAKYRKIIETL